MNTINAIVIVTALFFFGRAIIGYARGTQRSISESNAYVGILILLAVVWMIIRWAP